MVSREHPGTVNLRYLAPPAAVLAMMAGLVAGAAGLAASLAGPAGGTGAAGAPGPSLAWLMMGFVLPAAYLAGILGVTGVAARKLPGRVLSRLPVALVTMHVCWEAGFLASRRRVHPGQRAPSR